MADSIKQAWSDVGDSFTSLGAIMRERYRGAGDDASPAETATQEGATATDEGAGASDALRRAFEQVTAAVRELGDRVADVARDDDVKSHARRTASSLDEALSTTVDQITGQLNELFKRSTSRDEDPPTS